MLTVQEKRVIIFVCFVLLCGGIARLAGVCLRPPDTAESQSVCINVNSANRQELEKIPFIGSVTAQRIIDYRRKNGPLTCLGDLKNIKGIGDKKIDAIKDSIVLSFD